MSGNTLTVLLLIATISLWIALPLLPAMLIYHYFPNTPAGLKGPLQGLSLSAGGAFAAYFSTLLVMALGVNQVISAIRVPPKSLWNLDAHYEVHDENGLEVAAPPDRITVSLLPSPGSDANDGQLSTFIVRDGDRWPKIKIDVPGYGSKTFPLDQSVIDFDVDQDHYNVKINSTLVIRKPRTAVAGDIKLLDEAARQSHSANGVVTQ